MHHILAELQVPGECDEVRSISELEPTLADAHARGIAADGDQRVLAIVVEADGTTLPECGRTKPWPNEPLPTIAQVLDLLR